MREERISFRKYLMDELPKDIKTLLTSAERFDERLPDTKIFCRFPDSVKVRVIYSFLKDKEKIVEPDDELLISEEYVHVVGFLESSTLLEDDEAFINKKRIDCYKHEWIAGVGVDINLISCQAFEGIDSDAKVVLISGFDITTPGPERHILKSFRFNEPQRMKPKSFDSINLSVPIITTDGCSIKENLSITSDLYKVMRQVNNH